MDIKDKKLELDKKVKSHLEIARETYIKNDGFQTMLIADAVDTDGTDKVLMFVLPEGVMEHKREAMSQMGVMLGQMVKMRKLKGIDAIYLVSEAWFSVAPMNKDGKPTELPNLTPSEDPNHREAIVVSALSRDGVNILRMYEIRKSWVDGIISVSFLDENQSMGEKKDESKEDELKAENPLLNNFWKGYEMVHERWKEALDSALGQMKSIGATDKEISALRKKYED